MKVLSVTFFGSMPLSTFYRLEVSFNAWRDVRHHLDLADAVIGNQMYAARLLYLAARVEPMSTDAVEAQQLMNRSAAMLCELDEQDHANYTKLHRTLEFAARSSVQIFIPWDSSLYNFNVIIPCNCNRALYVFSELGDKCGRWP